MMELITRVLNPIKRKIQTMISRVVISAVTDTGKLQRLQISVLADEVFDDIERVAEYGFTSNPPVGTEGVVLFIGGDRAHGVVIGTENRAARLKSLVAGESAQYTDEGCYVWLKRSKKFEARSDTFKFQGATNELMDQLVKLTTQVKTLADKLNTTTTNTMLGPMKLNDFVAFGTIKTAVTAIETALTGLKGS